jgi:hypothetical protein
MGIRANENAIAQRRRQQASDWHSRMAYALRQIADVLVENLRRPHSVLLTQFRCLFCSSSARDH